MSYRASSAGRVKLAFPRRAFVQFTCMFKTASKPSSTSCLHASVQRIFDGEKEANPEGADAYPITTFTWLLFYRQQDAKKAEVFLKLVEWCATEGQAMSDSLGYIPLPAAVVAKIKIAADRIQ
jgi:hypothetical protein